MVNHLIKLFQHFVDRVVCFYGPVGISGEADYFRHILFFTIEADTGVEGNTVNPGGNLTFFSEFGIGFPKVQYHILIQIIERSIGIGIQIAYLVDHPFIFADHRQKLLFNRGANLCCLFSHGIYDYFSG